MSTRSSSPSDSSSDGTAPGDTAPDDTAAPGRRGLLRAGTGAALGAAVLLAGGWAATPSSARPNGATGGYQHDWAWCVSCQSLWYRGSGVRGRCPGDPGGHTLNASYAYYLSFGVPAHANRQTNWLRCTRCQVLAYGGFSASGTCTGGIRHSHHYSYDYALHHNLPEPGPEFQGGWRWCVKCLALFYAGHASFGSCPVYGQHVIGPESMDYQIRSIV
ncbi:hypothetical protein JNUCC64_03550 [Streptomyces sp. JNUCC 64]